MGFANRSNAIAALATVGFGVAAYLLLPAGVIAFDDDFGYLRSVVATIQHGFPRTDDWLEPWAASLSGLSALIFVVTGSFTAAIFTPQILGGAGTFAALWLLLRARGYAPGWALAFALLLASAPTALWKWGEFTALVVYLPCLVAALWAAERERWRQFFLFWAIAVASRQSAAVWLILPAWQAGLVFLRAWRTADDPLTALRRGLIAARSLLALLAVAALWIVVLATVMNQTHSQTVLTANLWRDLNAGIVARNIVAGLVVLAVAIGLGALSMAVARHQPMFRPWRRRTALYALVALALVILLAVALRRLGVTTNGWAGGIGGGLYLRLLILLGLAGWVMVALRLKPSCIAAALTGIALLSLRPVLYDYYLIDVFLFGFVAVAQMQSAEQAGPARQKGAVLATIAILLALQGYFALVAKNTIDRAYGRIVLAERALRQGAIAPAELGFAPFGYVGWKLHRYFIAHEGRDDPFIAGFIAYLDTRSVIAIEAHPLVSASPISPPGEVIATDRFPVALLFDMRTSLVRRAGDGMAVPRRAAIAPAAEIFPLDDEEWRLLVRGKPVAARSGGD